MENNKFTEEEKNHPKNNSKIIRTAKSAEQVIMAKLADYAYCFVPEMKNGQSIFRDKQYSGWYFFQISDVNDDIKNTVFCAVNDEERKVVTVFKGSEPSVFDIQKFLSDWCISDIKMLFGELPLNFYDFLQYVAEVRQYFKEYNFFMTGHSLGGSIAQLIASVSYNSDIKTYTFNAFGAKKLLKTIDLQNIELNTFPSNIHNYIVSNDLVSNSREHIGYVYKIEYNKTVIQSVFSIISEVPKIFVNLPQKLLNSLKYFRFVLKKLDAHFMNNFTRGFEYKQIKPTQKKINNDKT